MFMILRANDSINTIHFVHIYISSILLTSASLAGFKIFLLAIASVSGL